MYDGGTRGDGLISGPGLTSRWHIPSGKYDNLFHAVDWLPTLASGVGVRPAGKPLDGVDHLRALQHGQAINLHGPPWNKAETPLPREEIFVGYSWVSYAGGNWYGPAMRHKNWKLIQGGSGGPLDAKVIPKGTKSPAMGGDVNATYLLFDVSKDFNEAHDVAKENQDIVQMLMSRLQEYQKTFVGPPPDKDPSCPFPGLMNHSIFGKVWNPWCGGNSTMSKDETKWVPWCDGAKEVRIYT